MLTAAFSLRWLQQGTFAEATLLERAKAGDESALNALVLRYRERILNLCFQILRDHDAAEDAAPEVFLKTFARMGQFRGEADFGTWLYRIGVTNCLQLQRNFARRQALAPIDPDAEPEAGSSRDFRLDMERRQLLEAALDALPEVLRLPLILREWHSLSYEELADVLEIPVGTVRSRLHEARRKIRSHFEEGEL